MDLWGGTRHKQQFDIGLSILLSSILFIWLIEISDLCCQTLRSVYIISATLFQWRPGSITTCFRFYDEINIYGTAFLVIMTLKCPCI